MDSRESAFWVRLKANRWAYTFTILPLWPLAFSLARLFPME